MTYTPSITMTGRTLTTLKHTCGDAAETLDDVTDFVSQTTVTRASQIVKCNVIGCLITVEDNPIRFAWGTDPTQAGVGHVLASGQSIKLTNYRQITDFRFINHTNGDDAIIQITPEISVV